MKIAGILFRTIGILALIGTGLLIFLMTVVGDRYCHIQIRNERDDVLIVKTVGNNPFNRNPGTDSVVLKPNVFDRSFGSDQSVSKCIPSDVDCGLMLPLQTKREPVSESRRIRMALDVAKGMNYLHSCTPPIVHR